MRGFETMKLAACLLLLLAISCSLGLVGATGSRPARRTATTKPQDDNVFEQELVGGWPGKLLFGPGGFNVSQLASKGAQLVPAKLANFSQFKQRYNKAYKSIFQELFRLKIYLANSCRAATSAIAFLQKRSSCFSSINSMSDWTEAEFEKTLLDKREPLLKRLQSKLSGGGGGLSATLGNKDKNNKDKKNGDQKTAPGGPNPGRSVDRELAQTETLANLTTGQELAQKLSSLVNLVSPKAADFVQRMSSPIGGRDHRLSGCLGPVKDQGACRSCFIFSTLALYEWMYCMGADGGQPAAFSEQYVIDCGGGGGGGQLSAGFKGCSSGGTETQVALFSRQHGLELQRDYPYLARRRRCPYKPTSSDELQAMGFGHLADGDLKLIEAHQFEQYLDEVPILTGVHVSANFRNYGGGVDDGQGCNQSTFGHALLLVGDGHQAGLDYWLFRNSYGSSWGEQGYYKLAKDSDCTKLDGGIGYVPATHYFGDHDYAFKLNHWHRGASWLAARLNGSKRGGFFGRLFGG